MLIKGNVNQVNFGTSYRVFVEQSHISEVTIKAEMMLYIGSLNPAYINVTADGSVGFSIPGLSNIYAKYISIVRGKIYLFGDEQVWLLTNTSEPVIQRLTPQQVREHFSGLTSIQGAMFGPGYCYVGCILDTSRQQRWGQMFLNDNGTLTVRWYNGASSSDVFASTLVPISLDPYINIQGQIDTLDARVTNIEGYLQELDGQGTNSSFIAF